ncbi:MAG TPA: hypothetical protein DCR93_32675, partial [Cytophagales bacterium]|nr:hypothetical protein [Cytophagales bacterium]
MEPLKDAPIPEEQRLLDQVEVSWSATKEDLWQQMEEQMGATEASTPRPSAKQVFFTAPRWLV